VDTVARPTFASICAIARPAAALLAITMGSRAAPGILPARA